MSRSYLNKLRQKIREQNFLGERVSDVSVASGVCEGTTLLRWKVQAEIDSNVKIGAMNLQSDELRKAQKRIKELEDEFHLAKDSCALFNQEMILSPRVSPRSQLDFAIWDIHYTKTCRVVALNRSTYFENQIHRHSDSSIRCLLLKDIVTEIRLVSRDTYGRRWIKAALEIERGLIVNHKLVSRIMTSCFLWTSKDNSWS